MTGPIEMRATSEYTLSLHVYAHSLRNPRSGCKWLQYISGKTGGRFLRSKGSRRNSEGMGEPKFATKEF